MSLREPEIGQDDWDDWLEEYRERPLSWRLYVWPVVLLPLRPVLALTERCWQRRRDAAATPLSYASAARPFPSTHRWAFPATTFRNSSVRPLGHVTTSRSIRSRRPTPNVSGSSDCDR
jgi:hypothetical protein